jgi:hypothetical protein
MGIAETPKSVLRRAAAASLTWKNAQLCEDRPDEVVRWCEVMLRGTPEQAGRMTAPVVRLDYAKLDDRIVEMVEASLYYALTGHHRPARQQPGHPLPVGEG